MDPLKHIVIDAPEGRSSLLALALMERRRQLAEQDAKVEQPKVSRQVRRAQEREAKKVGSRT